MKTLSSEVSYKLIVTVGSRFYVPAFLQFASSRIPLANPNMYLQHF